MKINSLLINLTTRYISDIKDTLVFEKTPVVYTATTIKSYPYTKYVMPYELLINIFKELRSFKLASKKIEDTFCFEIDNHNSFYFTALVDYFQEECRLKCRRVNAKIDALEFFEQNKKKFETEIKKPITYQKILDKIYAARYTACSEFDPVWLTNCIWYFETIIGPIKNVLDMSAGRGARMLACAALNINYLGVDPSECAHAHYEIMKNFAKFCGSKSNINFIKSGFEEPWEKEHFFVTIRDRMETDGFDLMFSSPPYFDLEIYENTPAQSINKFSAMETWLNEFLYVSMKKILSLLRPGGIMAMNIDNPIKGTMDYVNPMLKFQFDNAKYIGPVKILYKATYTVWCWQKI